jgi:phosphoglycolate phosphatase-like HAD superfamily hydrolase
MGASHSYQATMTRELGIKEIYQSHFYHNKEELPPLRGVITALRTIQEQGGALHFACSCYPKDGENGHAFLFSLIKPKPKQNQPAENCKFVYLDSNNEPLDVDTADDEYWKAFKQLAKKQIGALIDLVKQAFDALEKEKASKGSAAGSPQAQTAGVAAAGPARGSEESVL